MSDWKTVWITGASSGIGLGLARALAREGAQVAVTARSEDKLSKLSSENASIKAFPGDVSNPSAMAETVGQIEKMIGPIDLAVLNAGLWLPSPSAGYDADSFARSMTVNYLGVTNALAPLTRSMMERRKGQIAVVASVAGYRGLPKSAYYGPTKSALINLCESLQPELSRSGIKLQIINPGFVKTPMTDVNTFPMPFLMEPEDAVDAIVKGLKTSKFEIAFPWQLAGLLKLARMLPYPAYFAFIRAMMSRSAT
jgi:short-subunit dehydrogenase